MSACAAVGCRHSIIEWGLSIFYTQVDLLFSHWTEINFLNHTTLSIPYIHKKKLRVKLGPKNDPKWPHNFELSFTQNVVNLVQCVVVHLGVVWTLEYEQISMIERLPPSLLTAVMNAHWFSFVENWVDFSCIRNRLEVRFICSMRNMVGHKKEFAGWLVCNLLTRSRP